MVSIGGGRDTERDRDRVCERQRERENKNNKIYIDSNYLFQTLKIHIFTINDAITL
jgi:hypothetical protein